MSKASYDSFAKDFHLTRKNQWPEFDFVNPYIKKFDRVLDLGCGNGRFRKTLAPALVPNGNYFGFDLSEALLSFAREQFPKDHFFKGNFADKLLFGSDNFNVVVSIAAFHHLLSQKDQLNFLTECYRVLKPGGILFLTTWKLPKKYFWSNLIKGRFKNWLIPFGQAKHPRIYRKTSARELKKLLKKSGFEVIKSELFLDRNFIALGRKSE